MTILDSETKARYIFEAFCAALRPARPVLVSDWALAHRVMTSGETALPGKWSNDLVPYAVAPMDAMSPTVATQIVVLMVASQMFKTEVILNALGTFIDTDPCPILIVYPTKATAQRWSKQRLTPLVKGSLSHRINLTAYKAAGNTLTLKTFPGGVLILATAQSPSEVASTPVRVLVIDEFDRCPTEVGNEGSFYDITVQRTANFWSRKIILASTPTIKGVSPIEAAYKATDQCEYYVACPACLHKQTLRWENLLFPRGDDGKITEVGYACSACGFVIPEGAKPDMLARGEWRAGNPGSERRGFKLNALYAPLAWPGQGWRELAIQFLACGKDPVKLQAFFNLHMAETWDDSVTAIMTAESAAVRATWKPGDSLPAVVSWITAGVDVQSDRLEAEVVAWAEGEESWSLDYRIFPGDTLSEQPWDDLDQWLLHTTWHIENHGSMAIGATCVDSGYLSTQRVYAFCGARAKRRVWAVKGQGGQGVPIWPLRANKVRSKRTICSLFRVGTDASKDAVVPRLAVDTPGPGYCHIPVDRDITWFQQMLAEKPVYTKGVHPRRMWEKRTQGSANEALDCRVYAYAALHGLLAMGRRMKKRPVDAPQTETMQEAKRRKVRFVKPDLTESTVDTSAETAKLPAEIVALPIVRKRPRGRVPGWF